MAAVAKACARWPRDSVHFEHFTPPEEAPAAKPGTGQVAGTFKVKLARRGGVFEVPEDRSIVQVLREHGVEIETSCESGLCGTCRTRYLSGDPEHRDHVLDDEERLQYVMPCCARSRSSLLVLDL
jgi:vanillate O-demethylase ferredoxin subunit